MPEVMSTIEIYKKKSDILMWWQHYEPEELLWMGESLEKGLTSIF